MTASPLVSVVVTAHNEAPAIGACLRSIAVACATYGAPAECILVDDRSTDGTAELARAAGAAVTILRIDDVPSPDLTARQAALDLAFRTAAGEVVCVTDADALVDPEWIRRAVDSLEQHRADAVAGLVRFRSGGAPAIAALQTVDAAWFHAWCRCLRACGLASGAVFGNLAFRRGAYDRVGRFAAIGPTVTEDLDFVRAVHRHGLTLAFDARPSVSVVGAPGWAALRTRLRRFAHGGVSALSVSLGAWVALLVVPAIAAAAGVPGATGLAVLRYVAGVLAVSAAVRRAGLGGLVGWAVIYEPLAIVLGAWVAGDRLRGGVVEWGGRRYDAAAMSRRRTAGR